MTQFNKTALKRIAADVSDIIKNPLEDNGVYYKHDEDTIVDGYALIIGPSETPYSGGIYLFHFIFPNEYPHLPPKVIFCTGDGETRFNPNFYKNGNELDVGGDTGGIAKTKYNKPEAIIHRVANWFYNKNGKYELYRFKIREQDYQYARQLSSTDTSYPKSFKGSNKIRGSSIDIMVRRGNEVDLEYEKKNIISKINAYFGYQVVKVIKIITFEGKLEKNKVKKAINATKKNQIKKINNIKNIKIKSSLLELSKLYRK